jgi:N-methylhydantoinase B
VANNRLAHWVEGDLESMIGACELASRRITALVDRYDVPTVRKALQANVEYSERRVRAEIASWPDGEHVAETLVDHDYAGGRDIRIVCKATVSGSDLVLDFTGSAPQVRGFVNSPIANTLSFVFVAVATCCEEGIPINEGYMAPVKVIAPEGTIVNPRRPAPVGHCTGNCGAEISEVVLKALEKFAPQRVGVNAHKLPAAVSFGHYGDGRMWVQLNFIGITGGAGAAYETDGWGLYPPLMTGVILPSIEMTEIQYPTRVLKHEYIADTTGAGRWRGAPGLETLIQHTDVTRNNVMMSGVRNTTRGFCGANDGAVNRVELRPRPGEAIPVFEVAYNYQMPAGGEIWTIRGGGGGWGSPLEREAESVRADVLDGYVTEQGALRDYGVVMDALGFVDQSATTGERQRRVGQ